MSRPGIISPRTSQTRRIYLTSRHHMLGSWRLREVTNESARRIRDGSHSGIGACYTWSVHKLDVTHADWPQCPFAIPLPTLYGHQCYTYHLPVCNISSCFVYHLSSSLTAASFVTFLLADGALHQILQPHSDLLCLILWQASGVGRHHAICQVAVRRREGRGTCAR